MSKRLYFWLFFLSFMLVFEVLLHVYLFIIHLAVILDKLFLPSLQRKTNTSTSALKNILVLVCPGISKLLFL